MLLVQREEQLTQLHNEFKKCILQNHGHVVLISGPVGSGKTGLLERFSGQIEGEAGRVLRATGSPAERNIPLGLVGQLFHNATGLTEKSRNRLDALLTGAALPAAPVGPDGDPFDPQQPGEECRATELHEIFAALLELADSSPLVITIDDVQHADHASLCCLQYVVRRIRNARILVVITESPVLQPPHRIFKTELLSLPCFSRISLQPLSGLSMARMADESPEPAAARRLSEHAVSITGGSPLLARALFDDPLPFLSECESTIVPLGMDVFGHAVLRCVYRHEPTVRRVAQAIAVLGRPARSEILEKLLNTTPEFTAHALQILKASGLVDSGRIRHPQISRAILDDLPESELRKLHRRAAEVLHHHGDEPAAVAEHLVRGDCTGSPWAGPVLKEAAHQALSVGRPDKAGAFLRLAKRSGSGGGRQAGIDQMLVRADWQVNPLAAKVHLSELIGTAHDEGASAWNALPAVPYLLWQGLGEEARSILSRAEADCAPDAEAAAQMRLVRLLASFTHPGLFPVGCPTADPRPSVDTTALTSPGLETFGVLTAALGPTADEHVVTTAEHLLHRYSADAGAVGLLVPPLIAILYSGRPDRVVHWTESLMGQSPSHHAPTWMAIFRALRAEAALRLGDLPEAAEHARRALKEVTPQAWGVAIGIPLATLIMCAAESGRSNEMASWLCHPVPPHMFETPLGLNYLAARARYHLITGNPKGALADLDRCRDLMGEWKLEAPGLVPWRLETAQVHLALGNKAQAARLVHEQLDAQKTTDGRIRGRALRLLAKASPVEQQEPLLSEAIDLLQTSGDNLELAHALIDLAQTLRRLQESTRCQLLINRAHELAQTSGADAFAQWIREGMTSRVSAHPPKYPPPSHIDDGLTKAERRVGALAAQGLSNRQISSKLFITVSTVEQHLTRIYRKLEVKRRDKLPAELAAYMELDSAVASGGGPYRETAAK